MQANAIKEQTSTKPGRSSPIQIVPTARLGTSNTAALREVQMSLARAEQNLYNLAHAGGHTAPIAFAPANYGFAAPMAYPAPPYPAGFAPSVVGATPNALALGMTPSFGAWPGGTQPAIAPWGLASGHPVPTAIPQSPAFAPGTHAANPAFLGSAVGAWSNIAASRTPACDILDEGKQFVCVLDLPGVTADQVELLCFEHAVVINATREADGEVANLVQSERGASTQQRIITLPNEIQPAGTKATLSNGILTVVLPKAIPTEGPRRIKVQG